MQVLDFVKVYQAKSDEELIQLAAASEQLTFEARLALQGELCRRAISLAVNSEIGPQNMRGVSRSTPTEGSQPCNGESEGVGDFIADVLRVYHSHFWLFFKINAPAVIVTTIAIITARNAGREIARQLPRVAFKTEILEIWLVNCSAWIISWMAFCVVFAATCIAVEESAAGFTASAWNSFLTIRERFNPFLRLSLLLMVLVLVMEATSGLFGIGVFWVLEHWRVHSTGFLVKVVSYGLVGLMLLIVSRFFLAVPAVILDDYRVGQAMFRSDTLTQGRWLTLAALLAKSLIGGYVAAMCPFWLASFFQVSEPVAWWFPWILTVVSMIAVTVVEPTMFVGFALLYLKMSPLVSAPSKVLTSQVT